MCSCLTPQLAAGLIVFIVLMQGLLVTLCSAMLQWTDCGMSPPFEEFSFGLFRIRIDGTGPVPPYDVNLHTVVDAGKSFSTAVGHLATATDATFGLLIAGVLFGFIALVVGVMGAMPKPPGNVPGVTMLRISAGLLGFDGLLIFIAVLVYTIGVMPNLKEMGIAEFVGDFASGFSSLLGGALAMTMSCNAPYMCSGLILTILEVIMLFAGAASVGLGVSPEKAYSDYQARDMRAEMMQFNKGGGPMQGKGGKGGKGGPPPMQPGYGGPPSGSPYASQPASGYGGPPPGYGGPPPPGRNNPFEGGPGAPRMGPGYGAPPPQQGYGYNYGGKGY